ncbi:MAG: hypothetical protein ACKO33_03520 [Bacteroidota bacterium]
MSQIPPKDGSPSWVQRGHQLFLSGQIKKMSERLVLTLAILSYLIHLLIIAFVKAGVFQSDLGLFNSPISAIYTPFSFILVYEVYLLLFYLPKSTTFYIGKQYEIITLIVIRRIFKDLGELQLVSGWFQNKKDLQFTFDVLSALVLFYLIYLFYHKVIKRQAVEMVDAVSNNVAATRFIFLKKAIALLLVPVLVVLAGYSFFSWVNLLLANQFSGLTVLANVNTIFFDEFFTILIIVDVLLLLASFYYSDQFHVIIRNSGFVLSTILIKLSFSVAGPVNNILVVSSVLFGLLILYITQLYEKSLGVTR